jgi:hypothetical protein
MGRATYSHFSMVAHTEEAILLPAGKLLNRIMPTKPTINSENPTHMPLARQKKSTPNTTIAISAMFASIRPLPPRWRLPERCG